MTDAGHKVSLAAIVATLTLCTTLVLPGTALAAAPSAIPSARVTEWDGRVEYSNNGGAQWRPVEWRKYLLPGYRLRTGPNGSATLQLLPGQRLQQIGNNTVIEIEADQVHLWSGELSEPREQRGSTVQALWERFQLHQRYMVTRRSLVDWEAPERVRLARTLQVDDDHTDLVWHHAGPGFSYELTIDDQAFPVPPAAAPEFIRVKLPTMPAGTYEARVSVLYGGEVVHEPARPSRLIWADRATHREHLKVRERLADDPVSLAAWQLDQGYRVAAMDTLRSWHGQHPHSREIRPLLAVAYGELGLGRLQALERTTWERTAP